MNPKKIKRNVKTLRLLPPGSARLPPKAARSLPAQYISSFTNRKADVRKTDHGVRVRHCEQVLSVNGSASYAGSSLAIQPGNSTSFPWLSQIAKNYDEYTIHSLVYRYANLVGTARDGLVALAIAPDPRDAAPATMISLMQKEGAYQGAISVPASTTQVAPTLMAPGMRKFVRRDAEFFSDIRVTDAGNFVVATEGCDIVTRVGTIIVEFDIEFFSPTEPSGVIRLDPPVTTGFLGSVDLALSGVELSGNFPVHLVNGINGQSLNGLGLSFGVDSISGFQPGGVYRFDFAGGISLAAISNSNVADLNVNYRFYIPGAIMATEADDVVELIAQYKDGAYLNAQLIDPDADWIPSSLSGVIFRPLTTGHPFRVEYRTNLSPSTGNVRLGRNGIAPLSFTFTRIG